MTRAKVVIRCREKVPHEDRGRMKFKCTRCGTWVCGWCEGGHSQEDQEGNGLCDPCWYERFATGSYPSSGSRWRGPAEPPSKHKTETRTVLDRTLGGHVVYVIGSIRGKALYREWGLRVPLSEWKAWEAKARLLEKPR